MCLLVDRNIWNMVLFQLHYSCSQRLNCLWTLEGGKKGHSCNLSVKVGPLFIELSEELVGWLGNIRLDNAAVENLRLSLFRLTGLFTVKTSIKNYQTPEVTNNSLKPKPGADECIWPVEGSKSPLQAVTWETGALHCPVQRGALELHTIDFCRRRRRLWMLFSHVEPSPLEVHTAL